MSLAKFPEKITLFKKEDGKEVGKGNGHLTTLQNLWLATGHFLVLAEHLYKFKLASSEACDVVPATLWSIPNPLYHACRITSVVVMGVAYHILVVATIAFQVFDHLFEEGTLGPADAIHGYEFSQATHHNTKTYYDSSFGALKILHGNMNDQHTEMKQQLQERHKDIANHVGEDIADAQNALGHAIVDVQNELGQRITDAQNALGDYIVDAQNANGEAIIDSQNYITLQHNTLSKWLSENLCLIYKQHGGVCASFIGPIEEDQSFIPVEFHWPEGQPTFVERLEQINTLLSIGATDIHNHDYDDKIIGAQGLLAVGAEAVDLVAIKSLIDAHSVEMQTRVAAMESQVDTHSAEMQLNAQMVESKVDAIEEMLSKLMEMLAKE